MATAAEFKANFVCAGPPRPTGVVTDLTPPPTVSGCEDLLGRPLHDVQHRGAMVGRCGGVKKDQLVGTGHVVTSCDSTGSPASRRPFELDPLHDPPGVNVQTGNDLYGSRAGRPPRAWRGPPTTSTARRIAPARRRPPTSILASAVRSEAPATPPEANTGRAVTESTSLRPVMSGPAPSRRGRCRSPRLRQGGCRRSAQRRIRVEAPRLGPASHRHLTLALRPPATRWRPPSCGRDRPEPARAGVDRPRQQLGVLDGDGPTPHV